MCPRRVGNALPSMPHPGQRNTRGHQGGWMLHLWMVSLMACQEPAVSPETPETGVDLVVLGKVDGASKAVLVDDGVIVDLVDPADPRVASAERRREAEIVTAGFVDAHAHPMSLGDTLATLDLTGIGTYRATLDRIGSWMGEGFVLGRGWDQNDWPDNPMGGWPLAADLETVLPGRKIALSRVDGHAMWVSTAVLEAARISRETPDPAGGRIERDATGAPTGVLVDTAMDLVELPGRSADSAERQLREALDLIAASGLTGVHAMGVGDDVLALYEALDRSGELKVRIWAYLRPDSEAAERLLRDGPWRGDRLAVLGIKTFADGALGSRGAWLSEPYSDEPDHAGLPIIGGEELKSLATGCLAADAQLAVHAIGDRAVTEVLDAFEVARVAHPDSGALLRVEHAQVVRPADRARFKELGAVASMQPTHATSDMPWAGERLGDERVAWAYTWRSLKDAGALLAFGSDFPVEGVSPALGLWAATTRTDARGMPSGGWTASERLTVDEAVAAFTLGAAQAVGEKELGALAPGMKADMTLWRTDRVDSNRWMPVATVVDGEEVWVAASSL